MAVFNSIMKSDKKQMRLLKKKKHDRKELDDKCYLGKVVGPR